MLDFGVIEIDPKADIHQTQPRRLAEKKACELGITEAELIRRAIEDPSRYRLVNPERHFGLGARKRIYFKPGEKRNPGKGLAVAAGRAL